MESVFSVPCGAWWLSRRWGRCSEWSYADRHRPARTCSRTTPPSGGPVTPGRRATFYIGFDNLPAHRYGGKGDPYAHPPRSYYAHRLHYRRRTLPLREDQPLALPRVPEPQAERREDREWRPQDLRRLWRRRRGLRESQHSRPQQVQLTRGRAATHSPTALRRPGAPL
jgi:hypothetical protein